MSEPETQETRIFRLQPKQREFQDTAADIAFYGGSAGSGKSFSLLSEPLGRRSKHVSGFQRIPGFTGVVFRRTSPEITNPGGLWDEASNLYPSFRGTPYVGMLEYRWPSGARIAFRHLQHEENKHSWHGAQICYLAFDEVTHFSQSQFWYLLSRNRSVCGVTPYVRATCNPEPGWVKDLLAPWVDGGFDGSRAASGELRWFVRVGGEIRWVPRGTEDAKSLTFIRASIYDNQILLEQNPEYLATLKALPPVERARLLDGDWDVRREGLVYTGFETCIAESHPDLPLGVGGIDFGFNNPFAAGWGFVDHDDVLWVIQCRYQRQCTIPIHAENIPRGPRYYADPAQPESIAQLRTLGHDVIACVHRPTRGSSGETRTPKLSGIDMVSERIRTNRLRIYRPGCLPLLRELATYHYPDDKASEDPVKEDDHACDMLRYMCVGVDRNRSPSASTQAKIDREYAAREAMAAAREAEQAAAEQSARAERLKRLHDDPFEA